MLDSTQVAQLYVDLYDGFRKPLNELIDRLFNRAQKSFDAQHLALTHLPVTQMITTNWDRAIETAFSVAGLGLEVVYKTEHLPSWSEHGRHLLKLHGDIQDKDSLVFTHEDYLGYVDTRGPLEDIAHAALMTRAVLFLGFSLQDPHFRAMFSRLRYIPRRSRYPAYALFIQQRKELLEYWSNRGFSIINLSAEASSPEQQLAEFMQSLSDEASVLARSPLSRIKLLVRECKHYLAYAGSGFTIRVRAALGPFGSPEPDPLVPIFSDSKEPNWEHEALEWELHQLVREYITRGSSFKLICSLDEDGLLRKYTPKQVRRRLRTFFDAIQSIKGIEIVRGHGQVERNIFILGDFCVVESRKDHSIQKLYSEAHLISDREQVTNAIAQFDRELDVIVRQGGVDAHGRHESLFTDVQALLNRLAAVSEEPTSD
jgi:hypothetical protein